MIVVRNVFNLKFGKAKEAVAAWKEGQEIAKKGGMTNSRILTDVTGPSYTLVFETSFENFNEFQTRAEAMRGSDEWQKWYHGKIVPLVESGHREIFNIVS